LMSAITLECPVAMAVHSLVATYCKIHYSLAAGASGYRLYCGLLAISDYSLAIFAICYLLSSPWDTGTPVELLPRSPLYRCSVFRSQYAVRSASCELCDSAADCGPLRGCEL
jgi:hypothetical protein